MIAAIAKRRAKGVKNLALFKFKSNNKQRVAKIIRIKQGKVMRDSNVFVGIIMRTDMVAPNTNMPDILKEEVKKITPHKTRYKIQRIKVAVKDLCKGRVSKRKRGSKPE